MSEKQENTASKPNHKIKIGSIQATVWKNDTQDGRQLYSVQINRVYKDGDDFKSSDSFSHKDLLNVAKVAERAEAYIAQQA